MSFGVPKKQILTQEQLESFKTTSTYDAIIQYITVLNEAVVGVKLGDECEPSDVSGLAQKSWSIRLTRSLQSIDALLSILEAVGSIAKSTPPVENSASRFGNPAFKSFYDKVSEESRILHEKIPGLPKDAFKEVSTYFNESWGNRTRIDYGSGHELNFLCWL